MCLKMVLSGLIAFKSPPSLPVREEGEREREREGGRKLPCRTFLHPNRSFFQRTKP